MLANTNLAKDLEIAKEALLRREAEVAELLNKSDALDEAKRRINETYKT